ncbi:MAG: hypothetical protein A4E55_01041 [Pelotomaculum sp. PtaU1.Bin035]|nr:MAG: hypothetical protein A4E55_01041 [Pelotomaculum sp. PtaU1.Bin035]
MEKFLRLLGWFVIIGGVVATIWAGLRPALSFFAILAGILSSTVLGVLILAFGELLQNVNAIRQCLESAGRDKKMD